MNGTFFIPASPAAMLAAAACVIAGGPWFADGLRALRRRRALLALTAQDGRGLHEGTVLAHGVVGLESPLFAPLSARPCAGFVLELRSPRAGMVGRVSETRSFRLATPEGVALVEAKGARWDLKITEERTIGSSRELSENVATLLSRTPETRWLVARGGDLVLTERALHAGARAGVLGTARRTMAQAVAPSAQLARTGTNGPDYVVEAGVAATPTWTVGVSEALDPCVVSDRDPSPAALAPSVWRTLGAVLGPALALAGLLQLAHAAGESHLGGL